jgi:hypothetical protein
MTEKLKKTRPRKKEITEYEPDDPSFTSVPRSSLIGETDGVIGASGHAYVHRDLAGKRFKILIYRDNQEKKE